MFESLQLLPQDPILGLMGLYQEDLNPNKVDLGVGVYKTSEGKTPVLQSVKMAEKFLFDNENSKTYIGGFGNTVFNETLLSLALGPDHSAIVDHRVATIQVPGGCGALRVGAELIQRSGVGATVWMSDPTWANHVPLFAGAGLNIKEYPYYDQDRCAVRFEQMIAELSASARLGDVLLLHGCCHNPCGADLDFEQWVAVTELVNATGLIPFVDMAYQGFGSGLQEDAAGMRYMAENVAEMFVSVSCSKNFGLYRERVGQLIVIAKSSRSAQAAGSQLLHVARGMYSMPPSHGASIVANILASAELSQQWAAEVTEMRNRINGLRTLAVEKLNAACVNTDFGFIKKQYGMFSFLGISPEQVARLKNEFSIYMVDSSRINVAGLNSKNIDYFAESVARVL